jgi:hypothetical protein
MWNFRAITPFKEKTVEALREYPERYKNSRQKNKYGNSSNRTSDISANESS